MGEYKVRPRPSHFLRIIQSPDEPGWSSSKIACFNWVVCKCGFSASQITRGYTHGYRIAVAAHLLTAGSIRQFGKTVHNVRQPHHELVCKPRPGRYHASLIDPPQILVSLANKVSHRGLMFHEHIKWSKGLQCTINSYPKKCWGHSNLQTSQASSMWGGKPFWGIQGGSSRKSPELFYPICKWHTSSDDWS